MTHQPDGSLNIVNFDSFHRLLLHLPELVGLAQQGLRSGVVFTQLQNLEMFMFVRDYV